MNQYKCCICDMDGTLLNSQDNISTEDEAALKRLKQYGIEVMIATGRLDLMVKRYIHQLELSGYVISCNGGLIRSLGTGEIVYSNAMDKKVVWEILAYCLDTGVDFLVYTHQMVISNRNNLRAIRYEDNNKKLDEELRFEVRYMESTDVIDSLEADILKVLLILPSKELVEYHINKYSEYKQLEVVSSAPGLVDIMATGSSKGNALKILAEEKKFDLKDIIAFGDNYNDIEMLKYAGMSIAMENAVKELKAVARYITKSNDESGIAHAVNSLHLYQ